MADAPGDQLHADQSISTFTSALWFNAAVAGGYFTAFLVLRRYRPRVYKPRTFLVEKSRQPPPIDDGLVTWIWTLLRLPDKDVLQAIGLDRFMVLRFLRMAIVTFVSFSLLAVPILIPINLVDQRDSEGLNRLTMGNVKDPERTWAHLVLSVVLSVGIIYYTYRETRTFLVLRRQYLLSPEYATSVTARTLYVPSIPPSVNNVKALTKIFSRFPGGVRRIWLTRNMKDLPDTVVERQTHVANLEKALTTTISACYKYYAKKGRHVELESGPKSMIPEKLRPTHRVSSLPLPFSLPLVGRKVDSIDYYHEQIHELNEKILRAQRSPESYAQLSSAFIEFNQQIAAHMAAQCVIHSKALQMAPRFVQIAPTDIIWDNMNIKSLERLGRRVISWALTTAIVIFWAIPSKDIIVTFVQAVSNIQSLAKVLPFLTVLEELPTTVVGIIQGIFPAIALAILVALVPIIFRFLSVQEGIPQNSMVDLSLLHKYFFFLFIDVVLVSTIAGGAINTFVAIKENPLNVVNMLAETLPKASTFFITYVMLQSFTSGQSMLQLVPLILSYVLPFLSTTPRDIYIRKGKCPNIQLGTLIPTHTVIFVLGIEYSVIAPLILPFVCLYFILQYFVYLYQFLFVYEMGYESGGLAFPRAIRHVYIGMFTWQLTMIGLFAVQKALPQMIIMIITLVVSCSALALYDMSFKPLFKYLPVHEDEKEMKKIVSKTGSEAAAAAANAFTFDDDKRILTEPDKEEESDLEEEQDDDGIAFEEEQQDDYGYQLRRRKRRESETTAVVVDAYHARDTLRKRIREQMRHSTQSIANNTSFAVNSARLMFHVESYMHPSLYRMQPTVWLPEDDLGIARYEMELLKKLDIRTSCEGVKAMHRGKRGQKTKIVVDESLIIDGGKGVPGEVPSQNENSRINDYVRHVQDSYNIVEALALTI
ncbi:hypothetical protein LRAMOSA11021 [Lichtheimia ramosa]|uniref:DUF221-domain-containing protein n=1 Tax=Lichtheimia ramosa TaxID=688394 RepID=A0A077WT92_9FUNG|nr:hypothetical protein LRAMOSA11021 [Lichtheimia ramosa]